MGLLLIIGVLILTVALFSVQNASPVTVSFLLWRFESSLAVILFLAVLIGAIIGALIVYTQRLMKAVRKRSAPPGTTPLP